MNRQDAHIPGVTASLQELVALRGVPAMAGQPGAMQAGAHLSPQRSRGMEFAETRPYLPGDDARAIDWRQTARRGGAWTKLFQEEQERPLLLLADLGAHMRFGTRVAFKSVVAARAAALLAWAAVQAGDRVGGIVCNGGTQVAVPPHGQERGALQLLQQLAASSLASGNAAGTLPLHALYPMLRGDAAVVLVSDFSMLSATLERDILRLAARTPVSLVHVHDVFETDAVPPGCYRVTDGAYYMTLDLRGASARTAYGAAFAARREALKTLARCAGAQLLPLATGDDPAAVLSLFTKGKT